MTAAPELHDHPHPTPSRSPAPVGPRVLLGVHTVLALAMTVLPSLFPTHAPHLRTPLWCAIAVTAGGLAVLLTFRPRTPRRLVLVLGWLQLLLTLVQAVAVGDIAALFGTWFATSALALLAGRLGKRPRKALVAAHVISAAAWVGIAVVFVALCTVALTTADLETARVTCELMELFDQTLLPWANFATTLTGIGLSLTSTWGLVRYWWVVSKAVISVAILLMAFSFLHDVVESAAEQAAHIAASGGTVAQLDTSVDLAFWGFAAGLVSLVAAVLLSLYKPGGRTPHGRRVAERAGAARRGSRQPRPVAGT